MLVTHPNRLEKSLSKLKLEQVRGRVKKDKGAEINGIKTNLNWREQTEPKAGSLKRVINLINPGQSFKKKRKRGYQCQE